MQEQNSYYFGGSIQSLFLSYKFYDFLHWVIGSTGSLGLKLMEIPPSCNTDIATARVAEYEREECEKLKMGDFLPKQEVTGALLLTVHWPELVT